MAASSAQRRDGARKRLLAFALFLIASVLNAGVTAQDDEVAIGPTVPLEVKEAFARGDMIPKTTEPPETEDPQVQVMVFPTMESLEQSDQTPAATTTGEEGNMEPSTPATPHEAADQGGKFTFEVYTFMPFFDDEKTPAPVPPRGDGPNNKPQVIPKNEVVCVSKEAVRDKNAVNLKLKASSTCEETRVKMESVVEQLCSEDCKLEIYQEDNTDEVIVSGKYVEDDVEGMSDKFNNDNIKDKTGMQEAAPRWRKKSKLVLVSVLLAGLLLAALLVAGYYLKTHRKSSKGVRLAESFQVDEENQANTLVSVAPLPQEPLDKPTGNGEPAPENGTTPTTNGHSATQTLVADTEM